MSGACGCHVAAIETQVSLFYLHERKDDVMGKYFVCDTHLTGLKQKMMLPPNRGYMVSVSMVTGISPANSPSLWQGPSQTG